MSTNATNVPAVKGAGHLTLSHSALSTYQECRRKYQLKYIDRLVPASWPPAGEARGFGHLFHGAMQRWHDGQDLSAVLGWLDAETQARHQDDERLMQRYCRAVALVTVYTEQYPRGSEDFSVICTEAEFCGDVFNPATGAASKLLRLSGRTDALIARIPADGWSGGSSLAPSVQPGLWIYELKTAARLDEAYIDSLWMAPQTGLYAYYVSLELGEPVAGILYDIVEKAPGTMVRRAGETETEYQARAAALAASNKSGKTNAKRQLPETWGEYTARLVDYHRDPKHFHRESILIARDRFADVQRQLWLQGQDILNARRSGLFYRNEHACYGRFGNEECEYRRICASGDAPAVIDNWYRRDDEAGTARRNRQEGEAATAHRQVDPWTGEPMDSAPANHITTHA